MHTSSAKKYTESPVMMNKLELRTGGLSNLRDFDLRPAHSRNDPNYPARFLSVWLNCSANDRPITHLYQPANVYGVVNNHDYLEKSPADLFLESLNVTSYTKEQCQAIKEKTRGQSGNKFWGRSAFWDFSRPIMDGFVSRLTEQTRKRPDHSQYKITLHVMHGKKYEGLAIDAYAKRLNVNVSQCGIFCFQGHCFRVFSAWSDWQWWHYRD